MYAAENENQEVVKMLLEKGAQIDMTDKSGKLPSHTYTIYRVRHIKPAFLKLP